MYIVLSEVAEKASLFKMPMDRIFEALMNKFEEVSMEK
jgi:hypothetical protein